jgi:hypothetical protein
MLWMRAFSGIARPVPVAVGFAPCHIGESGFGIFVFKAVQRMATPRSKPRWA